MIHAILWIFSIKHIQSGLLTSYHWRINSELGTKEKYSNMNSKYTWFEERFYRGILRQEPVLKFTEENEIRYLNATVEIKTRNYYNYLIITLFETPCLTSLYKVEQTRSNSNFPSLCLFRHLLSVDSPLNSFNNVSSCSMKMVRWDDSDHYRKFTINVRCFQFILDMVEIVQTEDCVMSLFISFIFLFKSPSPQFFEQFLISSTI